MRSSRRRIAASLAAAASVLALAACGSAAGGSSGSSITLGEIFPFTGSKAELSSWGVHGVQAAMSDINKSGGVMGKKLKAVSTDDAADSVDALPALRKLLLSSPVAVIGPFSPTIEAVIHDFQPNDVADFALGGTAQLDDMNYPYVFRTFASDSTEATAMAIHAIKSGYKTASLIFDNSANSQGFVAPLEKAFSKLGGKVLANEVIVPGQTSYRSELVKAFANHPQIIFCSFDTQTASTLWSDAQQLGYQNIPWQGDDLMAGSDYAKAFGPKAKTDLFAALPAPPSGAAYSHFLAAYKAAYPGATPLPSTYNIYDSVVIASLAMEKAKSTDPKVWIKDVTSVANPPGTVCTDFASCSALIKKGTDINYEGAGGSDDFNSHHNVFSGFSIVGFNGSINGKQVAYVPASAIAQITG
ncbi:MAG TPA: ABC transporter substrate-binding protein [Solirubrobacteraceae bacterium]|nr:ABC transporter substrate-binding protein [Solirubrobacteraceae bacterium]